MRSSTTVLPTLQISLVLHMLSANIELVLKLVLYKPCEPNHLNDFWSHPIGSAHDLLNVHKNDCKQEIRSKFKMEQEDYVHKCER